MNPITVELVYSLNVTTVLILLNQSLQVVDIRYLVIEKPDGSMQGHAFRLTHEDTVDTLVDKLKAIYRKETSTIARLFLRYILLRRTTVEIAKLTSVCPYCQTTCLKKR